MKQRIITAIIALLIFVPVIVTGGYIIDFTAIVLGIVAMSEIFIMKKKMIISMEAFISYIGVACIIVPANFSNVLPGFLSPAFIFYVLVMLLLLATVFSKNKFNFDDAGLYTIAMLYIGFGFHYFIVARQDSLTTLLYALFIIWCTDSGAYFVGKYFGKNKLAKHISPNKTWEGSVGGTVIATIVCAIYLYFFPISGISWLTMILFTIILSIFGQLGDLVESALKRFYGVKDSGKILPGHGGILDRFDSLLFVLPLLHLLGIV